MVQQINFVDMDKFIESELVKELLFAMLNNPDRVYDMLCNIGPKVFETLTEKQQQEIFTKIQRKLNE